MSAIPVGRRRLFQSAAFVRLWSVGGIANAVLFLEILAASLYVLDSTGSGWAVALVSAARAAPLLLLGALTGIVSDAWNRKHIVVTGLLLSSLSAGTVSLLAALGVVRPLYVALAALVSGAVYATEMPSRRRMVAEAAGASQVDAAVAADSLTGYVARCLGPIVGGVAYQHVGLAGAFLVSSLLNLTAVLIMLGLDHRQPIRRLALGQIGPDLAEALRFAIRVPTILMLLAVTITMNLFGYSYATLVAPIAKLAFGLPAEQTGLLAAAEPLGSLLGGLLLTRVLLPGSRLLWLMAGVAILTTSLIIGAALGLHGASFGSVCLALAAGGIGSAIYTNNQTSIVIAGAPIELRSRIMGLITICIGSWPVGMLLAGALVERFSPLAALGVLAGLGLGLIICLSLGRLAATLVHRRAGLR